MAGTRSEASMRVITTASARASPCGGSRRRPTGNTSPPPNGFSASINTKSKFRANRTCWKPSSSTTTSVSKSSARRDPVWKRSAPIPTGATRERRKICGSSPVSAVRTVAPAASAMWSTGEMRPYPRVRIPGLRPPSRNNSARRSTHGVFPVPPIERLPTLITGTFSRFRRA